MADPRGFLNDSRARTPREPARADSPHGLGGRQGRPREGRDDAAAAGGPLHGLRHSVLPPGVPARQPHSRVERPHVARALGRRHRPPPCDQQLPRVHGPHLPRAVRDRVRAGHQPARGDHQERRGVDHRRGVRAGPGNRPRSRNATRARRSPLSAPGPRALPPRSSSRARATPSPYTSARTALAASCATACPSFKMEKIHIDRRVTPDGGGGHGVPHGRRDRQRHHVGPPACAL